MPKRKPQVPECSTKVALRAIAAVAADDNDTAGRITIRPDTDVLELNAWDGSECRGLYDA